MSALKPEPELQWPDGAGLQPACESFTGALSPALSASLRSATPTLYARLCAIADPTPPSASQADAGARAHAAQLCAALAQHPPNAALALRLGVAPARLLLLLPNTSAPATHAPTSAALSTATAPTAHPPVPLNTGCILEEAHPHAAQFRTVAAQAVSTLVEHAPSVDADDRQCLADALLPLVGPLLALIAHHSASAPSAAEALLSAEVQAAVRALTALFRAQGPLGERARAEAHRFEGALCLAALLRSPASQPADMTQVQREAQPRARTLLALAGLCALPAASAQLLGSAEGLDALACSLRVPVAQVRQYTLHVLAQASREEGSRRAMLTYAPLLTSVAALLHTLPASATAAQQALLSGALKLLNNLSVEPELWLDHLHANASQLLQRVCMLLRCATLPPPLLQLSLRLSGHLLRTDLFLEQFSSLRGVDLLLGVLTHAEHTLNVKLTACSALLNAASHGE
jgi:hypothetical protein